MRALAVFPMKQFLNRPLYFKATRQFFIVLWLFILLFTVLSASRASASPANDLKDILNQQINDLQTQIDGYRTDIGQLKQQGKTLKRELDLLSNQTKAVELEIERSNLIIGGVEKEIVAKDLDIAQADDELAGGDRVGRGDALLVVGR